MVIQPVNSLRVSISVEVEAIKYPKVEYRTATRDQSSCETFRFGDTTLKRDYDRICAYLISHQRLSSCPPLSCFLILHLSLIITMTDKLPPNLLALFAPRPALRWVPPSDHGPAERRTATIGGIASFLPALEEYKETDVYVPTESWLQRKDRIQLEKKQKQEKLLTEGPLSCKFAP